MKSIYCLILSNEFTVPMALVDYIPVVLFSLASILLMRDLHNKMNKRSYSLFSAGCINITMAGFLKATWKLLYALNICDFQPLDKMFFPVQSLGFLLAGIGLVLMLLQKHHDQLVLSAPVVFMGTFLFVGLMITGLGMIAAVLCILAIKIKKQWLIALFVLAFICSLGMGYLSSQNFTKASMNWIAEGVNIIGQGSLFIGSLLLHKNGLESLRLKGEN